MQARWPWQAGPPLAGCLRRCQTMMRRSHLLKSPAADLPRARRWHQTGQGQVAPLRLAVGQVLLGLQHPPLSLNCCQAAMLGAPCMPFRSRLWLKMDLAGAARARQTVPGGVLTWHSARRHIQHGRGRGRRGGSCQKDAKPLDHGLHVTTWSQSCNDLQQPCTTHSWARSSQGSQQRNPHQ